MARKSLPLVFVLLSILAVALPYSAAAIVGGWSPIANPKDPEVVRIGQFAVTEHNKEANTNLQFVNVVRGEKQVVAGTKYRLVVSATEGGAAKDYRAVVWSKPWQKFLQLISFEEVSD